MSAALVPLPQQPTGVTWPTRSWPAGALTAAQQQTIQPFLDEAFAVADTETLGETHALLLVQGGRLVLERYGKGFDASSTHHSWSMGKSITQALTGFLVADKRLDIHAPAPVPQWQGADDPRKAITLDQLLRMSSGLKFVEDYVPGSVSDVIEMLFGSGKDDTAAYAAGLSLEHAPGSFWSYASGTTNIISRCLADTLERYGPDFEAFMRQRLFDPLGMTSPQPRFDAAGTFIGSSFCFCTAQDFARFGLLYLRGGVWEGRQLLAAEWVDYARTPTPQPPTELDGYGAQWWLGFGGPGSFSANGYDGQFIILAPDLDLILVRHGKTPLDKKDNLKIWVRNLIEALRQLDR